MPGPEDVIDASPRGLRAIRGNAFLKHTIDVEAVHVTAEMIEEAIAAGVAMDAKAAETGARLGQPDLGGKPAKDQVVAGGGGWLRSYPLADVYYSKATGAHEVHGDIRWKYDALGGAASALGLPVTDEQGTPDGHGAYNHFEHGSIYWSDHTGPMMVTGRIRDVWAAQGWEAGSLGYPVIDEHRMAGLYPDQHPDIAWGVFENGVVVATRDGQAAAPPVAVSPADLRRLVRRFVDEQFRASPRNVGLHPPVETFKVSPWGYDLWAAKPRSVMFHLHGFHDNGAWADTDFLITLALGFSLTWPMSLTEPSTKTLVATLEYLRVTSENNSPLGGGIPAGGVIEGVTDGIRGAFFRGGPDPQHPEVPDGAVFVAQFPTGANQTTKDANVNLIDVFAAADGGIGVFVNPLPTAPIDWGLARRNEAERMIRELLDA